MFALGFSQQRVEADVAASSAFRSVVSGTLCRVRRGAASVRPDAGTSGGERASAASMRDMIRFPLGRLAMMVRHRSQIGFSQTLIQITIVVAHAQSALRTASRRARGNDPNAG